MKKKQLVAIFLAVLLALTSCVFSVSAANVDAEPVGAGEQITVYFQSETAPYIYYWNSLPTNVEIAYPGVAMTKDNSQEGGNWYKYTFNNLTKVNLMFTAADGTQLSGELTRSVATGATSQSWYYKNNWRTRNPYILPEPGEGGDFREDTIYFVMTTRFYDGNTGNNVHCWDDGQAGNPDTDPAWRGDFQGLIDKLDYIKALGFSAIWITPVVTNASGYDYHGYHAMDFSTVDARYESEGATYQDLIDAAHDKKMKIVQDVVMQHTGNFGESYYSPLFEKKYDTIKDLENLEASMVPTDYLLDTFGLSSAAEYYAQIPHVQYQQRLNLMKDLSAGGNNSGTNPAADIASDKKVSTSATYNPNNYYHNGYWQSLNWDDWTAKYCQIAGDCVDLNTENPATMEYVAEAYGNYINMGVDAFRVDTVRHVSRLTLNMLFNPQMEEAALNAGNPDFYMFGEICVRGRDVWYRNHACESAQFYTWKESNPSYESAWKWDSSRESINSNMNLSLQHWIDNDSKITEASGAPTSDNAFLNGNEYHKPDYSEFSGMGAIDFLMHWSYDRAQDAFNAGVNEDKWYNDSTWNVVYVDSHDYAPDNDQNNRFSGGTATWAENLSLMFTFRGIPCLYYGSEVEFKKGMDIDEGPNQPLEQSGRAYFGDYLEGTVVATDFSEFTASGTVKSTLEAPLSKHLSRLNEIRRTIPALQKGQYSRQGVTGDMAFKRRYTNAEEGIDSFVCVSVTGAATFTGIPNGTYIDAVTGDTQTVTSGSLSIAASGKGNMRAYVLSSGSYTGISGKVGENNGTYLK